MATTEIEVSRRPIKARSASWSGALAGVLARVGLTPNQVSLLSIVNSVIASSLMLASTCCTSNFRTASLLGAALFVQFRLLCNLLDGLMAIEGGKRSRFGELFNEMPDRVSDTVILVAAGYASNGGALGIETGWMCALLAMATAYIRAFGAQITGRQDFCGPMAKQHRMFVITIALVFSAVLSTYEPMHYVVLVALMLVAVGSLLTCIRRVMHLVRILNEST